MDREGTTSQLRMRNSAKLWGPACVRGLEAAASLVRRAKVWVTPQTCGQRCGHVAGTIIYRSPVWGEPCPSQPQPAPRRFDFVVLDAVSGQCGGRGLRVVAASKRRAIAWLTPFACYTRCLDVWAPTVVLGSHSNHVRAPSLRLSSQGVVRHWTESGGWGCKRAVYCRRISR